MSDFVAPFHRYRVRQLLTLLTGIPSVVPDGGYPTRTRLLAKINPGLYQNFNRADSAYGRFAVDEANALGWNSAKVSVAAEAFAAASPLTRNSYRSPTARRGRWECAKTRNSSTLKTRSAPLSKWRRASRWRKWEARGRSFPPPSSTRTWRRARAARPAANPPTTSSRRMFAYEVYQVGWEKDKGRNLGLAGGRRGAVFLENRQAFPTAAGQPRH